MKIRFKHLFSPEILDRGYKYYKQGRVSNLLKIGDMFTANVSGTHNYRVSIDTLEEYYYCNCPFGGRCKHLVAVFYKINNAKNIRTINESNGLQDKSKKELIKIINKMLKEEPKLSFLLLSKKEQVISKIENLDKEDEETYTEFYDYIPDRVEEIIYLSKKLDNTKEILLHLLQKVVELNEKHDHHGSTEDSIIYVLEHIERNKKTDSEIKKILGKDYDEYMGYLESD